LLELRNVSKQFGDLVALAPTTLQVSQGDTLALLGTSGSGKSTLLRLMVGLVWPDQGEVYIKGERLSPEKLTEARLRMGYVIQEGGLFPHLTAYDNLALQARYLRRTEDFISARIEALCQLVQLPKNITARYPQEHSGGQRQRIALMRALMLDPELLLLDEPLGALDPIIRTELQDDLKTIFSNLKKTVVLVTHDVSEAAFLCHKIVLLREGKIVQQGALSDFLTKPADPFVTRFFQTQRGLPNAM
jgi:osmoprotectant transport system ATP-binding protein